jgi:hypothetical protein
VRPKRLCQGINSNDTIGNRTRDIPVCGAVPQPTAPPTVVPAYIAYNTVIAYFLSMLTYASCVSYRSMSRIDDV